MIAFKPEAEQLSEQNFLFLKGKIYQHSGIVIEQSKQYLLEARLLPILQKHSLRSLNELSSLIRANPAQFLTEVVESMTTHESYFFRDQQQFDALRTRLIPEIMARNQSKRKVNCWSAAASSGQEAYTLAMTIQEMKVSGWKFDILATDLSERILNRARSGSYSLHEVERGLAPEYRARYFQPAKNGGFQVCDPVRRMIDFRKFDLRQSMRPLGTFDLILCRNVLIYFDLETKRRIFDELAGVLAPEGILLLGGSETTLGISERFQRLTAGGGVYYRLRR